MALGRKLKFKPKAKKGTLVRRMQKGVSSYLKGSAKKGLDFDDTPSKKRKKK